MKNIATRLERLEDLAKPAADVEETWLYETLGELEAVLPPGVVPAMPADTWAKPDMSHVLPAGAGVKAQLPDIRNRQRPE